MAGAALPGDVFTHVPHTWAGWSRLSLARTVHQSPSHILPRGLAFSQNDSGVPRGFLKGPFQRASTPRDAGRSGRPSGLPWQWSHLCHASRVPQIPGKGHRPLDGRVSRALQPCFKSTTILLRVLPACAFVPFPWTKWCGCQVCDIWILYS